MKFLLALTIVTTLSLAACGNSSTNSAPNGSSTVAITDHAKPPPAWLSATTSYIQADADKDNDVGTSHDDTNNNQVLDFGRPASGAEKRSITAIVKRYYTTALAGEGAKACSMIYSTFAEAIAEDYGQPGGPTYMRGAKTCAAALSELFKYFHAQLEVEVPKLGIAHVLVKERHAMVVLSFGTLSEREIPLTEEGHVWKMSTMLDSELP